MPYYVKIDILGEIKKIKKTQHELSCRNYNRIDCECYCSALCIVGNC